MADSIVDVIVKYSLYSSVCISVHLRLKNVLLSYSLLEVYGVQKNVLFFSK